MPFVWMSRCRGISFDRRRRRSARESRHRGGFVRSGGEAETERSLADGLEVSVCRIRSASDGRFKQLINRGGTEDSRRTRLPLGLAADQTLRVSASVGG